MGKVQRCYWWQWLWDSCSSSTPAAASLEYGGSFGSQVASRVGELARRAFVWTTHGCSLDGDLPSLT